MSFFVQWFYLLALTVWVGGIVFFSFFTTPAVFSTLPKEMASQFLSTIFPRYYILGYACGVTLLLTTIVEATLLRQLPWIRLVLIVLMLGCTFYAGTVLRPQVHDIKVKMKTVEEETDLGQKLKQQFDQAHRLSVVLNVVVLVGGLLLLGVLAFRLKL